MSIKLHKKREPKKEVEKKLSNQNCFIYRSRKASITTGVVERMDALKNDPIDRLSPLSSSVNTFTSFPEISDSNNELEKFVDMDIDTQQQPATPEFNTTSVNYTHLGANVTSGSTRRHTVGPGDVEHEQALANPSAVPINFKFGSDNAPRLLVNLPMMQNQPLHNFTIKNQHLLKLPTVMEASKSMNSYLSIENINIDRQFYLIFQYLLRRVATCWPNRNYSLSLQIATAINCFLI